MGADESAALADELCELVARCSVPPPRAPEHPSAWAVTWHAVAALAEALVDTADGARGALGLRPRVGRYPSRPPTPPDHLQRGRAAQAAQAEEAEEAADGAEAEAAPEAEGGAPDGAHAVPAAGTATATAAEADHAARMELFAVIERRRARIAELRAQLDSLPAAKPSAVRKALGACGLKPVRSRDALARSRATRRAARRALTPFARAVRGARCARPLARPRGGATAGPRLRPERRQGAAARRRLARAGVRV